MFPAFEALLESALDRAVACGELSIVDRPACRLEPPADPVFGDATSRVAMTLARRIGRPAADVARTVASHVVDPDGWAARVEAAGPGFVNVEASLAFWRAALAARLSGAGVPPGAPASGRALVVQAASSEATVTARAGVVAEALARLLATAGHSVARAAGSTIELGATDGPGAPSVPAALARIVVVHDVAERDAARRAKAAVAAAGGRPGCVTAVPVGPLALRRRGRALGDVEAVAALAQPGVRFALAELAPDVPAELDLERLAGDRIDDPWTRIGYARERIARVGGAPDAAPAELDVLDQSDRECLRAVGMTPDVVALAARRLEPAGVAAHARALAAAFHRYYNRGRFADAAAQGIVARRALARGVGLALGDAVALVTGEEQG